MPSFWTNRGKLRLLELAFRGAALPASFNVALCTGAVTPTAATNVLGDLTQIAVGNGYTTGGFNFVPSASTFDVITEDDTGDHALIMAADVLWNASGGPIPSSGSGARWAVLTDNNATVASREIWFVADLGADQSVVAGQPLRLIDIQMRLTTPNGMTNRGMFRVLELMRGVAAPANFFLPLFTAATTPTPDTNTVGDLTQIATGNGYTAGGPSVSRNSTDFDVATEDDATGRGFVQLRDFVLTAAGGNLPASGAGMQWVGLSGPGATVGTRDLWCYWNNGLGGPVTVSDTQTITLQNYEIRFT